MTEKFNIKSNGLSTLKNDKVESQDLTETSSLHNISSYLEESKSYYAKMKKKEA